MQRRWNDPIVLGPIIVAVITSILAPILIGVVSFPKNSSFPSTVRNEDYSIASHNNLSNNPFIKPYENYNYGFSLQLPSEWIIDENPNTVGSPYEGQRAVSILPPGGWDNSETRFQIAYQMLDSTDLSPESFIKTGFNISKQSDSSIKIIEENPYRIDEKPAYAITYIGNNNSTTKDYYVLEIASVMDKKAITFWFIGFQPDYNNYLSTAMKMINSFKIIK